MIRTILRRWLCPELQERVAKEYAKVAHVVAQLAAAVMSKGEEKNNSVQCH